MNEEALNRVPGGRVVACSDEGFAPAENLLATRAPEFRFGVFIPGKGQEFDSWETRRHNPTAPDWAILELGAPGPIATVDIDTHWHDGNHAEKGALFGLCGAPGERPTRKDPRWVEILPPRPLDGHAHNVFRTPAGVASSWTHVMLENHPDGGIARLRCYPDRAPADVDPGEDAERRLRHEAPIPRGGDSAHHGPSAEQVAARWREVAADSLVDLACEALGGLVVATSNNRYGHSQQLIAEAPPTSMGDGWETSRSRGENHRDHVVVALGRPGVIEKIEVDFRYFVLNNPVALRLLGAAVPGGSLPDEGAWVEVVERTFVKTLAGSSLRLDSAALQARGPFTHLRLETFPDGGANRLRVLGRPTGLAPMVPQTEVRGRKKPRSCLGSSPRQAQAMGIPQDGYKVAIPPREPAPRAGLNFGSDPAAPGAPDFRLGHASGIGDGGRRGRRRRQSGAR